ncbi:MAG TPA: ABC transporter ATP-binding protein, partial [Burkholderiaceae bacterium]|nr:ABC transporter ATP-binding protein [Burkholderiaceae bacterium]
MARAGIGFVPEDRRVFADLTVFENLDVARRASGRHARAQRWSVDSVCALFPKLAQLRERHAGHLSGGEQQML